MSAPQGVLRGHHHCTRHPVDQGLHDLLGYEHLAACGHRQSIESTYTWQGAIHHDTETRVAIHTRTALLERIAALATDRHPYDVPCIIAVPITQASLTTPAGS